MNSRLRYKIILLIILAFSILNGFSQAVEYKDLSGIWHIEQDNNWYKHISLDFLSKYHEYSWNQIVNENDSISRTTSGIFKISKKDKEYIITLHKKVGLDEYKIIPSTIRFLIRKNTNENYSIQFLSETPEKDEMWDTVTDRKTYSLVLVMRTNE